MFLTFPQKFHLFSSTNEMAEAGGQGGSRASDNRMSSSGLLQAHLL